MGGPEVDILAVCTAITDACTAADSELRASPTVEDAPNPPAAVILPADPFINYQNRMGRGFSYSFELTLVAGGRVAETATMRRLYDWLNPRGDLIAAINAIPGVAVLEASGLQYYRIGGVDYPGAALTTDFVS